MINSFGRERRNPKRRELSLYWRIRKRIAIEYGNFLRRYFPEYVKKQMKIRKGSCDNCKSVWLCCGPCSWLKNNRCSRHEERPDGCKTFPINRLQIWVSGVNCNYTWENRRGE